MATGTESYEITLPEADAIRKTASGILESSEYRLEPAERLNTGILEEIIDGILDFLASFRHFFAGLYELSPFLAYGFVLLLLIILILLIWHIFYSFRSALRNTVVEKDFTLDEEVSEKPHLWERRAFEAAENGDYISGLRYLFRACLLRLSEPRGGIVRYAATNKEYLAEYAGTRFFSPLSCFVELIDYKWYGGEDCARSDYERGVESYEYLKRELKNVE